MKIINSFILILFFSISVTAQKMFDNVYSGNVVTAQLIQYLPDASMVIAGEIFDGGQNLIVARFDSAGNVMWSKKISATRHEKVFDLKTSASGKIFICGSNYFGNNSTTFDAFLMVFDSSGSLLSSQSFGEDSVFDEPQRIMIEGEGVVMTVGSNEYVNNQRISRIVKIDSTYNLSWQKNYEGGPSFSSIIPALGGGYVVSTFFSGLFFKFDTVGNYVPASGWQVFYIFNNLTIRNIKAISDSMYMAIGGDPAFVCFLDYNLVPIKAIGYEALSAFSDFYKTDHNTYILVGSGLMCNACHIDLTEVDTAGNFINSNFTNGGNFHDWTRPVEFDYTNGLVCIANDTAEMHPNVALEIIQTNVSLDSICRAIPYTSADTLMDILPMNISDLVPLSRVGVLTPFTVQVTDYPITYIDCDNTTLTVEEKYFSGIKIFPNPANSDVRIVIPSIYNVSGLKLIDLQGRTVLQKDFNETETTLNLEQFSKGYYFLILTIEGQKITRKLILN